METQTVFGILFAIIGLTMIIIGLIGYLASTEKGGPSYAWALLVAGFGLGIIGIVLLSIDSEDAGKDVVID